MDIVTMFHGRYRGGEKMTTIAEDAVGGRTRVPWLRPGAIRDEADFFNRCRKRV